MVKGKQRNLANCQREGNSKTPNFDMVGNRQRY